MKGCPIYVKMVVTDVFRPSMTAAEDIWIVKAESRGYPMSVTWHSKGKPGCHIGSEFVINFDWSTASVKRYGAKKGV